MRSRASHGALIAAILLIALALSARPAAAHEGHADGALVVCPICEVTSLTAAIAESEPGDQIEVHGGIYPGGLVIDRDVELIGVDNPVIDGGGSGTLVHVKDAAVTIQGFTLRGTGTSHDHEDTAILFDKGRATLLGNRIEDSLFGIYLKEAHGSVVRDNVVISKPVETAQRGDSVRIWYCDDIVLERNDASSGRDVILWYSNRALVRGNTFDDGRYGLHLMYSHTVRIEGNSMRRNSIGLYLMYSQDPVITGNSLSENHGPTGGGLGLKEVDRALIEGNRFVSNIFGAQVDASPRLPGAVNIWRNNVFAYNEVGIAFLAAERDNVLTQNSFVDNLQHIAVLGGIQLGDITWSQDGRGNYWSDYAGYDADGDGVGDVAYAPQHLFESLMDDNPSLRLFLFSPAAMAIDFAARAFPAVRPQTTFEDAAPLMQPPVSADLPPVASASSTERMTWAGAGIATALGALLVAGAIRRRPTVLAQPRQSLAGITHTQPRLGAS